MPLYLWIRVANKSQYASWINHSLLIGAGENNQTIFQDGVNVAEKQTSPSIELLLVEAAHERLVNEGHPDESVELVVELPQHQTGLVFERQLIIV